MTASIVLLAGPTATGKSELALALAARAPIEIVNGDSQQVYRSLDIGTGKPTASVAWCSADSSLGSPMVTTTDGTSDPIVWDANTHLWGYDGDTGAKVFTDANTAMTGSIQSWNTPIAVGKGRIAVGVNGQLYLFSAP